jgi:hypothetical protein
MQTIARPAFSQSLYQKLRQLALPVAVAMIAAATPHLAVADDRFVPVSAEAGTDIPKATIKFGMRPCRQHLLLHWHEEGLV